MVGRIPLDGLELISPRGKEAHKETTPCTQKSFQKEDGVKDRKSFVMVDCHYFLCVV